MCWHLCSMAIEQSTEYSMAQVLVVTPSRVSYGCTLNSMHVCHKACHPSYRCMWQMRAERHTVMACYSDGKVRARSCGPTHCISQHRMDGIQDHTAALRAGSQGLQLTATRCHVDHTSRVAKHTQSEGQISPFTTTRTGSHKTQPSAKRRGGLISSHQQHLSLIMTPLFCSHALRRPPGVNTVSKHHDERLPHHSAA
jgi:hypothetical protein